MTRETQRTPPVVTLLFTYAFCARRQAVLKEFGESDRTARIDTSIGVAEAKLELTNKATAVVRKPAKTSGTQRPQRVSPDGVVAGWADRQESIGALGEWFQSVAKALRQPRSFSPT